MIQSLADIIPFQARHQPDQLAFISGEQSMTYRELDELTDRLASLLHSRGVVKGDRVGILLHRSLECAVAVYGILKAGAVFVPMDPAAPVTRIQKILQHCDTSVLISSAKQINLIRELEETVSLQAFVGIEDNALRATCFSWEKVLDHDVSNDIYKTRPMPDDLAYIMFTSGSTGEPKGIMHTHASGLAYARLSGRLYKLDETAVIANVAPLFFDQCTFGYFTAPYSGATTLILTDGELALAGSLAKRIEQESVSILYSVPRLFIQLLESGLIGNWQHLKWILYGGEAFPPGKLNELRQQLPWVTISNVYGPAEVNQCTYYHITTALDESQPVPLGKAWDETTILLLDEFGQPVLPGKEGELLVSSSTMMTGYWRNESLTGKAIINLNVAGKSSQFYRTGDVARINEIGELVFLGRKDRQIKIRGYRVELDEIEHVLLNHPSVAICALMKTGDPGGERLVAAYASTNGQAIEAMNIKKFMSRQLPAYAIPERLVHMSEIPMTGSGKVDYKTLRELINSSEVVL